MYVCPTSLVHVPFIPVSVSLTTTAQKPMAFSDPLAALLGTTSMSRPQTVKHLWKYIKANELQDPSDKRTIVCDDAMRAVFKQDRVHMFTMNKLLNAGHLFPMEEEAV